MSPLPIVYLGPSLSRTEARTILSADFRPPLRSGDLDALPCYTVVGIVDGVLDAQSRLRPCEAIHALGRGIRLFGAASTGALLAAQLRTTGFVGIGRIFKLVALHPDVADDLVAVMYAEHDDTALTEPLVNAVLAFLENRNLADRRPVGEVIAALRTIPLHERTSIAVECRLQSLFPTTEYISHHPTIRNYKAEDARLLLHQLERGSPILSPW